MIFSLTFLCCCFRVEAAASSEAAQAERAAKFMAEAEAKAVSEALTQAQAALGKEKALLQKVKESRH